MPDAPDGSGVRKTHGIGQHGRPDPTEGRIEGACASPGIAISRETKGLASLRMKGTAMPLQAAIRIY